LAGFEALLADRSPTLREHLPSERELAARWGLSQAAVNRAAAQLIAAGRVRREGYRLFPLAGEGPGSLGARIIALSHRTLRFPGLPAEAARLGLRLEERFFLGRDSLRQHLVETAASADAVIMRLGEGGWEWDVEHAEFGRRRVPCIVCDEAPDGVSLVAEDWRMGARRLVEHLAARGHREFALLGSMRRSHRTAVVREGYEAACLRLRLGGSAERCVEAAAHTPEAVELALERILRQWAQVTALVLYDSDLLPLLLDATRRGGLRIAEDLSLVCIGDSPAARAARTPITCVAFDQRALGQVALDLAMRELCQVRRLARPPVHQRLRIEPMLLERDSVLALGSSLGTHAPAGSTARSWSRDRDSRLHEAEDLRLRPHRVAGEAQARNFSTIDLRALVNRSFARQNGWFGNHPLMHLSAGRHLIHGAPFEIIDERANHGAAALVLRSQRPLTQAEQPLPISVVVPVGRRVRAVYFLHACGYAGDCQAFAWYDFILEGRRPVSVPIVARGLTAPPRDALPPNIQDWWGDFPQFEAPGVKHFVVTANGDPFEYERYLYTLEWENPRPRDILREIRISSNPALATTLAVLAITTVSA
jgi:hypothetical protein